MSSRGRLKGENEKNLKLPFLLTKKNWLEKVAFRFRFLIVLFFYFVFPVCFSRHVLNTTLKQLFFRTPNLLLGWWGGDGFSKDAMDLFVMLFLTPFEPKLVNNLLHNSSNVWISKLDGQKIDFSRNFIDRFWSEKSTNFCPQSVKRNVMNEDKIFLKNLWKIIGF